MSEKEIIDNLWDLSHLNTYLDLNNEMKEKCEIPREVLKRWFENSKSLLDLYNKEKEKNKELQYKLELEKIDNKYNNEQIKKIVCMSEEDKKKAMKKIIKLYNEVDENTRNKDIIENAIKLLKDKDKKFNEMEDDEIKVILYFLGKVSNQ